jgi:hypothetical protein
MLEICGEFIAKERLDFTNLAKSLFKRGRV